MHLTYSGNMVSKKREQLYLATKYPSLIPAIIIRAASTTKNQIRLAMLLERKGAAVGEGNWPYHLSLVAMKGNNLTDFQVRYLVATYKCLRYFDTPRYAAKLE